MRTQTPINYNFILFFHLQGRQLLRQYLQEIGYTDTIIDVRSNRVRSLLGLTTNTSLDESQTGGKFKDEPQSGDFKFSGTKLSLNRYRDRDLPNDDWKPNQSMVNDAEASVLATFEFLNEQRENRNQEDAEEDEDEEDGCEEIDTNRNAGPYVIDHNVIGIDSETEEVLAEFDFLSTHPSK